MALTDMRRIFINEYLQCWNASEAARRAGYAHPGSEGHRLLKIAEIDAEIQRRIEERAMSADEALIRLADIARGSIEDFADIDPNLKNAVFLNFAKAQENGKLHLIKKIKFNAQGYPEIELYDAKSALDTILKHHDRGPDGSEDDPIHVRHTHELSDEELANIATGGRAGATQA